MSISAKTNDLAQRIAQEFVSVYQKTTGTNTGDLTTLNTTAKNSIIAAINEIKAQAASAGTGDLLSTNNLSDLSDKAAALTNLGGLTQAEVNAIVQEVVGAAPDVMNQLSEIANALNNDPDFAATVIAELSKRVRVDAAQSFTEIEKQQARDNISAAKVNDIGDVANADFVAQFEAALTTP